MSEFVDWPRAGTLNAHRLVASEAREQGDKFWVERTALSPRFPGANGPEAQHLIQSLAHKAGVLTPESHRATETFQHMSFVDGMGEPRQVLENLHSTKGAADEALTTLAIALAAMHSVTPSHLSGVSNSSVESWREKAEAMIQYVDQAYNEDTKAKQDTSRFKALLPLAEARVADPVLIHNDFRCGNFLVAKSKVTAILDYDLACFGDPWMDVSWFCCPKWRYQKQGFAAGGLGRVERFLDAYQDAGGHALNRADYAFWMAFSGARLQTLKWVQLHRGCDW